MFGSPRSASGLRVPLSKGFSPLWFIAREQWRILGHRTGEWVFPPAGDAAPVRHSVQQGDLLQHVLNDVGVLALALVWGLGLSFFIGTTPLKSGGPSPRQPSTAVQRTGGRQQLAAPTPQVANRASGTTRLARQGR